MIDIYNYLNSLLIIAKTNGLKTTIIFVILFILVIGKFVFEHKRSSKFFSTIIEVETPEYRIEEKKIVNKFLINVALLLGIIYAIIMILTENILSIIPSVIITYLLAIVIMNLDNIWRHRKYDRKY